MTFYAHAPWCWGRCGVFRRDLRRFVWDREELGDRVAAAW